MLSMLPSEHWYDAHGAWPGLAVFCSFLTALLAPIAVVIALWGDWLRDTFGWRGQAKLDINVDAPGASHHGWIDDAISYAKPPGWVPTDPSGRQEIHFKKILVENRGPVAAKAVTLWIKSIHDKSGTPATPPVHNVMPLRWSDLWHFQNDKSLGKISGSSCDISLATLPSGCTKYCDLLFHFDDTGPENLGGFDRNVLYLAVLNLPSKTFSMKGGMHHEVHLQLSADNAAPVEAVIKINFNPQLKSVEIECKKLPLRKLIGRNSRS